MVMQTEIAGPAGSAPDARDVKMMRIGPRRVTGQQIVDIYENNREAGWEKNYWSKIDESLHHMLGGPLRVDMRMATPTGWKPIGEAEVGEEVLSVDGKPTRIVGVYPQGTLGMYRVTFTDGAEVVCDESHSWTVSNHNGTARTLQLREILEQGLYTTNGAGKRLHAHRIPVAAPLELPEADLPLDPYLLGYLIGDGSMVGTSPSITCAEDEDNQPWRDVLPDSISVTKWHQTDESRTPQYGLVYRKRHTNPITAALTDLGLWGKRDCFKSIPESYLWASREQRWALFQGLCDSDGYSNAGGMIEIATVSQDLAQDLIQLVQSLGGTAKAHLRPSMWRKHNGYTDSECYRVSISLPGESAPFRLYRKVATWKPRKVEIIRAIHRVERIEDAEAICIKVDREDGLFLTEGMVVTHNTRFILPDEFLPGIDNRERMIVVFPQKMTTPLKVINMVGNKRPKAMRYAVGLGLRADNQSTDVETWLNAVLEFDADGRPLVNYREMVGRQLLEGAIVVKAISSDAHWRKTPSWLDVVDEEEWLDMSPRKQKRYAAEDEIEMSEEEEDDDELTWSSDAARRRSERPKRYMRVDKEGVAVPRSAYHRDAKGRHRKHGYYQDEKGRPKKNKDGSDRKWEEDRSGTLRAYRKDQKEWLAQRLPFEVEIISARHCIPLMDDNERIEAIIVCRQYEAEDLIGKDFVWGDDEAALIPAPDIGSVTVYELWHTDERDRPYVAYFVDGYEYTMLRRQRLGASAEADEDQEELADAVIDLQREYGCTRLPIGWFWGLHWPIDDVTKKAVPFLDPVLSSINAAEGLATATHIYAWRNAFAGSMIEIKPELLERYGDYYLKNADVFTFTLGPMENAVVPGRPEIQAAPAPGAGVQQLLQMLLQASAAMSPSDAVFGGAGAASGHDRALSKEYLEVALSQVLEGARMAIKFIAELILEYAVWIAEKTGRPVPVYANTPIVQAKLGASGKPKPATDIIELLPSWLKSNTRIHTYFEADDTDELTRNQLASQHMQGLVPWDQFRTEAWNDPNPEVTLAKIFGDQALRTPEGRQEIMEFAKILRTDEQDQEKQKLIDDGLLSEDGVPTEARISFIPRRLRKQKSQEDAGQLDLMSLLQQQANSGIGTDGKPVPQLPPGDGAPPGVPQDLAARHLQLDQSHAYARALEAPSGPLGAIGGPANGQQIPLPGTGPGGPQGPVLQAPPRMPPGVEGPSDINAFPKQFAAAPTLPGMSAGSVGSDTTNQALAGVIAGLLRAGAKNYHHKRRGPRVEGTGRGQAT